MLAGPSTKAPSAHHWRHFWSDPRIPAGSFRLPGPSWPPQSIVPNPVVQVLAADSQSARRPGDVPLIALQNGFENLPFGLGDRLLEGPRDSGGSRVDPDLVRELHPQVCIVQGGTVGYQSACSLDGMLELAHVPRPGKLDQVGPGAALRGASPGGAVRARELRRVAPRSP
jgi:hypothetical protein